MLPSSSHAALPKPGEVVAGKYRVDGVLGSGGMGVVLAATDAALGRSVAIKVLSPERGARSTFRQRFLREARSAAALQSDHVVRIFDVGELADGVPFIVMEHLRGRDLQSVVRERRFVSTNEACDWILQACEALGEAHRLGIVHRDLKPANVFLAERSNNRARIKVLDFGLSKAFDGVENITAVDAVMGTPRYMPPEQFRSLKLVDARADIWALGVILFEILALRPPYDALTAHGVSEQIEQLPTPRVRSFRPDVPQALEDVIVRCLHKDVAGRFANVLMLASALAPFATAEGRTSVSRIAQVVNHVETTIDVECTDLTDAPTKTTDLVSSAAAEVTASTAPAMITRPMEAPVPPPPGIATAVWPPAPAQPRTRTVPQPVVADVRRVIAPPMAGPHQIADGYEETVRASSPLLPVGLATPRASSTSSPEASTPGVIPSSATGPSRSDPAISARPLPTVTVPPRPGRSSSALVLGLVAFIILCASVCVGIVVWLATSHRLLH